MWGRGFGEKVSANSVQGLAFRAQGSGYMI